jgi:hypothetical protein
MSLRAIPGSAARQKNHKTNIKNITSGKSNIYGKKVNQIITNTPFI